MVAAIGRKGEVHFDETKIVLAGSSSGANLVCALYRSLPKYLQTVVRGLVLNSE